MSKLSDEVRRMFSEGDDKRDEGLMTPENILRYNNIVYGSDKQWQILDVYRPKEIQGKLPVIVSVHGGGWVYGDKERYQYYCMNLAQRGFAVVNFTYHLAPDFKFPAPLEDINLVFFWIMMHKEEYGFGKELFAVGDSAGAHLLGLYVNICSNEEYSRQYQFVVHENLHIHAVALNCGAYHMKIEENDILKEFLSDGGTEVEMGKIDVIDYITERFPPVFVMTATGDFLQSQATLLVQQLIHKKIPFVFRFFGDAEHELGHVFHLNIRLDEATACNDAAFFSQFLEENE